MGFVQKFITRLFSQVSQLFACKISAIQSKGNIFKFCVEQRWVGKICICQRINCCISEVVRDSAKVAIDY